MDRAGRWGRVIRGFFPPAGWTLLIFCTLPFGSRLVRSAATLLNEWFEIDYGYDLLGWIAAAIVGVALVLIGARFLGNPILRRPTRVLPFLLISSVYAVLLSEMEIAAEKIHFIEYGVLAYLFVRAWKRVTPSAALWPLTFFSVVLVGTLDEFIQYLHPERTGEFVDICWNVIAGTLPLGMLRLSEDESRGTPSRFDVRRMRLIGLFSWFVVGIFLFTAIEYGIEIRDPRGYRFHTRLPSPAALHEEDERLFKNAAPGLRRENAFTYSSFLAAHPEKKEPFLNEFRVHLFRRNRYVAYYGHYSLRRSLHGGAAFDSAWRRIENDAVRDAVRIYAAYLHRKELQIRYGPLALSRSFRRDLKEFLGGSDIWEKEVWKPYRREQLRKAKTEEKSETEIMKNLWIAEREEEILRNWFGRTLAASGLGWPDAFRDRVFRKVAGRFGVEEYSSAVAKRICTSWTKPVVTVIYFSSGFLILFGAPFFVGKTRRGNIGRGVLLLLLVGTGVAAPGRLFGGPQHPAVSEIRGTKVLALNKEQNRGVLLLQGNAAGTRGVRGGEVSVEWRPERQSLVFEMKALDTRIIATPVPRDGEVWRGDAFEIFLDTECRGRRYVEIEVSPGETIADAMVSFGEAIRFDSEWNLPEASVETNRDSDTWRARLEIPLSRLEGGRRMIARKEWWIRMNLGRVDSRKKGGGNYSYYAWCRTGGYFHKPNRWGILVLGED